MHKSNVNNPCPRLIEVALPIREISAESVRDKSLRHGHISTLHLWWARRPLAASRAVVFASLVPDPDDPRCPAEFRAAVERHLKTDVPTELKHYYRGRQVHRDEDPYRPYEGMPDTLRNRLLMFIAKWSPESLAFEAGKAKKAPEPKYLLDDRSLVKWETSDPGNAQGREVLRIARELVKIAHGGKVPTVLDPFAGGGAIPLEAGRLGCQPIANDYNPVAYLILRATCEFPQRYGKPGWRKVGGQASSLHNLEPADTLSLFEHPDLKATRRNFPHWELEGRVYYITFSTWDRFVIPEAQRQVVLDALRHWNGNRLRLHQAVIMPDHVHAMLEPLNGHELSKVLHSIKSFTANEVNKQLRAAKMAAPQHLWQPESFDRIVRDPEDYIQKWEYIRQNPVKTGICTSPEDYAWLYEDEVVKECSLEGCPPTWVPNVLAYDVEKWAHWILERARKRIGHLYPPGKDGKSVVGYLWARTAPCSNPSCRGEIPLLRSLLVCNKKDKKVALTMEVDLPAPQSSAVRQAGKERKTVRFGIAKGEAIKRTDGTTVSRGGKCPFCNQITHVDSIKDASFSGNLGERIVAVITEGRGGKDYRPVEETDIRAFEQAKNMLDWADVPNEPMPDSPDLVSGRGWNLKTWGSLFNPRQLVAMQTFVGCLHEALEEMKKESWGQPSRLWEMQARCLPPN
jgi:adenine-specific DNA methylase